MEQSYLTLVEDDDPMQQIQGHSITYRIAVGEQQGQKIFTLQTLPPSDNKSNETQIGQIAGFSLHAGIIARRDQSAGITNDLDHARQLTKHGASFEDARFYVFRRQGLQCYRCGNLIEKISHTGQACFCCPRCQQT